MVKKIKTFIIYALVKQCFRVVYREISLDVPRLKARVYTKKNQVTRGIFHGIPLENIVYM